MACPIPYDGHNKLKSSSAQSYIQLIDCALQTSISGLRAKNNVKKMSFECSPPCGMCVNKPKEAGCSRHHDHRLRKHVR